MKSGWPEPRKKGRIELITEVIAERGRGMERRKKIGVGMVLLGAALWGSSSNSVEYLMVDQHFTWSAILFWRMVFTGISFLGISLVQKQDLLAPLKKDWLWLLKFILLGMYLMQVTFFKAIYYSNAATATVLQYTMPAILLLMYLVKEQRLPTRREVVAVVLALLGTTLIATKGQGPSWTSIQRRLSASCSCWGHWLPTTCIWKAPNTSPRRKPAPWPLLNHFRLIFSP